MTAAELKTLRESLGLTAQWLANKVGVQLRTLQYWEVGRSAVPDDVAKLLLTLDSQYGTAARHALDIATQQARDYGMPETVLLCRYRDDAELWAARPDMQGLPVTAHAALLSRCRQLLMAAGFAVTINYPSTP